ncbi:MAG: hypothetical protein AAB407_01285 [Patescibacteria group bacterium]
MPHIALMTNLPFFYDNEFGLTNAGPEDLVVHFRIGGYIPRKSDGILYSREQEFLHQPNHSTQTMHISLSAHAWRGRQYLGALSHPIYVPYNQTRQQFFIFTEKGLQDGNNGNWIVSGWKGGTHHSHNCSYNCSS